MSSQHTQRSWWSRPRSSDTSSIPGSKRNQIVSTLSFASRIKPKRTSDIGLSPNSQHPFDFNLESKQSKASNLGCASDYSNPSATPDTSKIPLSSSNTHARHRMHSKTLPGNAQRPHIPVSSCDANGKTESIGGWSSKLGIAGFGAQKKGASSSDAISHGPSLPRRLTLNKRERLPLPKDPPKFDPPPPPTSPVTVPVKRPSIRTGTTITDGFKHEGGTLSPLSSTSKSSVQSSRVDTLSLKPSHSTMSSGTVTSGESSRRASSTKAGPQIPHIIRSAEPSSNVRSAEPSSNVRSHEHGHGLLSESNRTLYMSQAVAIPSQHMTANATPKRQASLLQLRNNSSPRHTLRHTSSFSPSLIGEESESYVFISTSPSGVPHDAPMNDRPLRMRGTASSRDSKYSNPEASVRTIGLGKPAHEDVRSVFSLPTNNLDEVETCIENRRQSASILQSKHIVPPEELRGWLSSESKDMNQDSESPNGARRNRHSFRRLNGLSSAPITAALLSHNSDDQGCAGLRPPPRRGLGLAARKQAALRKKEATVAFQPPVSTTIHKMEHSKVAGPAPTGSTVKQSRPSSLHRIASFLTLDEEEDQASSQMLTKEPTGPTTSWDSDTTSEEEQSFFDFGRGVNSMDLSEGFSD